MSLVRKVQFKIANGLLIVQQSDLYLEVFDVTSAMSDRTAVDPIRRDDSCMFVAEINRWGQVSGRGRARCMCLSD